MNLLVKAKVVAIYIVKNGGHLQGVIKRSVEYMFLIICCPFNLYGCKFIFPELFGTAYDCIKSDYAGFCVQICTCIFNAHIRNS